MPKILILGGTRYFGKRLVDLNLQEGNSVTIANRGLTPDAFGNSVNRLHLDRLDTSSVKKALSDSDWDIVYDQFCYSSLEAMNAVEALNGDVGHYVFTSTQSVYEPTGEVSEKDFLPESHPALISDRKATGYGEAKRRAEAVLFQKASFSVTAVRFSLVLGEDDYSGRLQFHLDRMKQGRALVIPNLQSHVSLIHSSDAAEFLMLMGKKRFHGAVNACAEKVFTMNELLMMMEKETGQRAMVQAEGSAEDETPFAGREDRYMSSKLARSLGGEFKSTEDWLPRLIHYYRSK